MYDRLLVPSDGSDPATAALDHALDIAADLGATVHVLNVANTNKPSLTRIGGDIIDVLEQEGEEIMSHAREQAEEHNVSIVDDIIQGDPRAVIVEYAISHDINLVVMGAHGRRELEEYVLGSVTDHVVNRSETPVLTIRSADEVTQSYPYAAILVPTDGSDQAIAAVELGAKIANRHGATLHLVSVVNELPAGPDIHSPLVNEQLTENARSIVNEAATLAEDANVTDIITAVKDGSVPNEIQSYAASNGIELIVMGTHGRTGLNQHLLGSITERVLRTAPAPVLTTKIQNE